MVAARYNDFVVFSHGKRANVVLLAQFFRQRGAHDLSAYVRRCGKVKLATLSPGRRRFSLELSCHAARRIRGTGTRARVL